MRARSWLAQRSLWLGLIAAIASPVVGVVVALTSGGWRVVLIVVIALAAAITYLIPAAKSKVAELRAETAEGERDEVRIKMRLAITDALRPLLTDAVSTLEPGSTASPGTATAAAGLSVCGCDRG